MLHVTRATSEKSGPCVLPGCQGLLLHNGILDFADGLHPVFVGHTLRDAGASMSLWDKLKDGRRRKRLPGP
jgi:hypothetical protein